jgi:serine/threonine-protein kinase
MEFIGGQNLNQVTNGCARARAVMPLGFSASVVHDCALALHYAHTFRDPAGKDYPVIHRDVAQKNIMLTYEGLVKLLDFGIAKARGTLGKTHAGAVKGTAGYMSPEQVRGEPLDGRSDVFSLGVVLYEMITGRRLFSGQSETDEMRMILEGPIARPSEVLEVIPEELSDVAMRALARDKADRFASAKEMSRALSSACGHLLFDQEQRAVFMRELFEEKMLATQQLMESAGAELDRDGLLEQAAQAMRDEAEGNAPTQQSAKKLAPRPPAAPKKKKLKKEGAKPASEDQDEVSAKAKAKADDEDWRPKPVPKELPPPPEKKESSSVVPVLVLLAAVGAGGFAFYKILGGDEPPPDVGAYQSEVPVPEFGQSTPPEPIKGTAVVDPPAEEKDKDKDKDGDKPERKGPAGQGALTLFTIPPGAKVMLKGKEVGKTPLLNQAMPAGTHLLMLVFPDGTKKKLSAQIENGKTAKFKFKEEELPDG